ncbi:hypothetical protein [Streptomyces jumonjinensis]
MVEEPRQVVGDLVELRCVQGAGVRWIAPFRSATKSMSPPFDAMTAP